MLKYDEIISKLTHRQKADLLTGKDFWSTLDIEELGIPSVYLSDGPHGVRRQQAKSDHLGLNVSIPATAFPTAATMANSWDTELGEEMGKALGEEAASQDVSALLGPGLNIKRNPLCGRNFEYFSEDPYLVGKMAAAYVRGIQSNGISACLKHFAANNQETRRMVVDSIIDERTLREIYLTGFEIAVKEGGARMVMSAYNKLNGTFANENEHLLVDILRNEWGYDKMVVTDWAGCNDRIEGLKCGNELEMPSCRYGADDVYEALEDGTLDESVVDENLDRLLDWVFSTHEVVKNMKDFDKVAHHKIAKKCAENSIVLLKNDGALPLKDFNGACVIGDFAKNPRYQGAGSSLVNPTSLTDFLSYARENGYDLPYAKSFDRYGKKKSKLKKEAVKLAQNSEKIIFFAGLDEISEAEGIDRENMKLPQNQLDLFSELCKTGKPIIVVLSCGSAVELGGINEANAILHGYLGGQAGAAAMFDAICGKVNPCGKLAETIPERYEDCPTAAYFPGTVTTEYREGVFVGYRYYSTVKAKVSYPFGYGLSYTTFAYSDLEVTDDGVTFKIKNTGSVVGAEIAQLYISKQISVLPRPEKELKGFVKVGLEAGEEKTVYIPFDDKTFRYFNVVTNGWETEGGTYGVHIGASCEDIRLSGEIEKKATTEVAPYDSLKLQTYFSGAIGNVSDEEFKDLLGCDIPDGKPKFYKKNRMKIGENSTVSDLRYARGWTGRFLSRMVRFAIWFMRKIGKRVSAATLIMGVLNQPVRGMAKFGGFTRRRMEGMITMFNGHFFRGFGMFITPNKKKKSAKGQ